MIQGCRYVSGDRHICRNVLEIMIVLPYEEIIEFRHRHHGEIQLSLRTTETVSVTDSCGNVKGYGGRRSSRGYIHGEIINS